MNYRPNISDPRTYKRIKSALGFTKACLSETKAMNWSTRYIDRFLGRQETNLGKWLRKHLLITTNHQYNKDLGTCKEYKLNLNGYKYIKHLMSGVQYQSFEGFMSNKTFRYKMSMAQLLDNSSEDHVSSKSILLYPSVQQVQDLPLIIDWAKNEFGTELETKEFTYDDKSNRLWHPLQRVRKAYKKTIFNNIGLKHQYDIKSCAYTLLHQYSQKIPEIIDNGKYLQGPMDLYLTYYRDYLNNKDVIRKQMSKDAQIPIDICKIIINALLAGAHISNNPTTEIYQLLQGDKARIEFLKQYPFLVGLRGDIKTLWEYIKPTMPRRSVVNKNNKTQVLPISSRSKWHLYFKLERQVLNQVSKYLTGTNNKFFLEHDGWSTESKIDEQKLIGYVYNNTGYKIELEYVAL
jgi:hypothetical protein